MGMQLNASDLHALSALLQEGGPNDESVRLALICLSVCLSVPSLSPSPYYFSLVCVSARHTQLTLRVRVCRTLMTI
jgi:hypothetical protein